MSKKDFEDLMRQMIIALEEKHEKAMEQIKTEKKTNLHHEQPMNGSRFLHLQLRLYHPYISVFLSLLPLYVAYRTTWLH